MTDQLLLLPSDDFFVTTPLSCTVHKFKIQAQHFANAPKNVLSNYSLLYTCIRAQVEAKKKRRATTAVVVAVVVARDADANRDIRDRMNSPAEFLVLFLLPPSATSRRRRRRPSECRMPSLAMDASALKRTYA